MPPRPFPLPINVGNDICHVDRILHILKESSSIRGERNRFLRRILTEEERGEFGRRYPDVWKWTEEAKEKKRHFRSSLEKLRVSKRRQDLNASDNMENSKDDIDTTTNKHPPLGNQEAVREMVRMARQDHYFQRSKLLDVSRFLAGRFAAKEAAIKAHRTRHLTFHDIWIRSQEAQDGRSQPPIAMIISREGSWEDAQIVPLSISHDNGYATAVCMAIDDE